MFKDKVLGRQLLGSRIGYVGRAHAPASGTYQGIEAAGLGYLSVADSGIPESSPVALRALAPLIAAALYEIGFAWEAGPLSTWSN